MGRLGHTLSTLRPVGRPARTQDSLPAVGRTLPGGLSVPLGPSERFLRCILHRFPPFPGFPWRKRASVARNLPQPARSARRGDLSPWLSWARTLCCHSRGSVRLAVLPLPCLLLPSAPWPATADAPRAPLPLHRRRGRRRAAGRRLLDHLQPQLPCLPLQRLDLLLLHLRLVLLLVLTHVRHPVLQRQVD